MSPGILHNNIYGEPFYEPDAELCLGLIKRLADALRELSDGAGCDHDTGICYCSEAALLEEAAAYAGGKLCLGCLCRPPQPLTKRGSGNDGYCWECIASLEAEHEDGPSGISSGRDQRQAASGELAHDGNKHMQGAEALGLIGHTGLTGDASPNALDQVDHRVVPVTDNNEDGAPLGRLAAGSFEPLSVDEEALVEFDQFFNSEPLDRSCYFTVRGVRSHEHGADCNGGDLICLSPRGAE